jgi:hypothetical protein
MDREEEGEGTIKLLQTDGPIRQCADPFPLSLLLLLRSFSKCPLPSIHVASSIFHFALQLNEIPTLKRNKKGHDAVGVFC